jgi:hypothetical protein
MQIGNDEYVNSVIFSPIALAVLANKLAKLTGKAQSEIQEEALIQAVHISKCWDESMFEVFKQANFPMIHVKETMQ